MHRGKLLKVLVVAFVAVSILLISLSSLSFIVPEANSWAISITQIDRLHELGFTGAGVTIGLVDTGVDIDHQEFDISSFVAWNDFINGESEYYDNSDHGIHIAGVLVSKGSFQGLGISLFGR